MRQSASIPYVWILDIVAAGQASPDIKTGWSARLAELGIEWDSSVSILSSWRCNREQAEPKLSRALKFIKYQDYEASQER